MASGEAEAQPCWRTRGFTLIELSIVLVVIGLIVGSVLVGKDLIKAAQVRSIITDREKLQTAINVFREKYDYLPGDLPNAANVLGTASMEGGANGNGNGAIDDNNSSVYPYNLEILMFWRHLAVAGLLDLALPPYNASGGFSGTVAPLQDPSLHYGNGLLVQAGNGWAGYNYGTTWDAYFVVGGSENNTVVKPLLTAQEAYSLDSKVDDGKPNSGFVAVLGNATAWWGDNYNCATTNDSSATYNLSVNTPGCLMFWLKMY